MTVTDRSNAMRQRPERFSVATLRSAIAVLFVAPALAAGAVGGGCSSADSKAVTDSGPNGGSGSASGSPGSAGSSGAVSASTGTSSGGTPSGAPPDAAFAASGSSSGVAAVGLDSAVTPAGSGVGDGSLPDSSSDAATSGSLESGSTAGDDSGGAGDASTTFVQRYEAEAVPPNVLVRGAVADRTCYGTRNTCPPGPLQEGANCCSGGGEIQQILGRVPCAPKDYQNCQKIGAGVEFHNVTVPASGTYDVTWWYHCGLNDFFGDKACGGVRYSVGTSCRPHLIDVNGAPISSTAGGQTALFYQFPCFPGAWSVLHAATTALPLTAGANVIAIHAPHEITLDAVDVDALEVRPQGQGAPPLATAVVSGF